MFLDGYWLPSYSLYFWGIMDMIFFVYLTELCGPSIFFALLSKPTNTVRVRPRELGLTCLSFVKFWFWQINRMVLKDKKISHTHIYMWSSPHVIPSLPTLQSSYCPTLIFDPTSPNVDTFYGPFLSPSTCPPLDPRAQPQSHSQSIVPPHLLFCSI